MTGIVNLRKARKAREKAEKRAEADRNAAVFGRSKAEKALEAARADKARADLDSHKRE